MSPPGCRAVGLLLLCAGCNRVECAVTCCPPDKSCTMRIYTYSSILILLIRINTSIHLCRENWKHGRQLYCTSCFDALPPTWLDWRDSNRACLATGQAAQQVLRHAPRIHDPIIRTPRHAVPAYPTGNITQQYHRSRSTSPPSCSTSQKTAHARSLNHAYQPV